MSLALCEAIFRRWNQANLDSTVAPLFFGDRNASPEGTALPRAQYAVATERERARSRGSRELVQPVRFIAWGNTDSAVAGRLDAIERAFLNAESALTDPLVLAPADGAILGVDHAGRTIMQEDDAVFRGILQIEIQWARPNAVPN